MAHDEAYKKAEEKIAEALKTGATELDFRNMGLTELPESIGQLTQLTSLDLSGNQLAALPDSLGRLAQLQKLLLEQNKFIVLPELIGNLNQLVSLSLFNNVKLITLPESLGLLKKLQLFDASNTKITSLPKSMGKLPHLKELIIWSNKLTAFPEFIGDLVSLEKIDITDNQITQLPDSISNCAQLRVLNLGDTTGGNLLKDIPLSLIKLEKLEELKLDNNPLNPVLQSAYKQGLDAVKAYLHSLAKGNTEPLYEAKLVLVGEGNVGKTTLLKALKGDKEQGPRKDESKTHGVEIDIHGLHLPHPEKNEVEIQLNAWDFGGQEIYRVTHQFFFSRRSLYLLVWEPRRNVQQAQIEDWLNMIRLRVGVEARVLIVSTHCKSGETLARIDKPVLQEQYGKMIVGFYEVDSLVPDPAAGEMTGIVDLKKVIAEESAKLEHMGMPFNLDWKAARDELITRPEAHIRYNTFAEVCSRHNLSEIDTSTLAAIMNDLGYIVHYSDDEKLRDDVVLKPEWLTKAIGFVLENRATAEREGILPDGELYKVWHDHEFADEPQYDPEIYPFFLRLMEKYDVSYRLPDDRKASLVAQHVPQIRPELPWLPEQEPPKDQRRIAMVCSMEEDPPGLVPWMIVRTHDYSVDQGEHHLHWQKGMFLNHGIHGTAMLEKREREFHIYAQAAWPEHFMNVLHTTLEKLINDNWPGLKDRYRFMVPCPETVNGQACKGRFNIYALREFLADGDTNIRCQECGKRQSITELLMGFEERSVDVQLREINERLVGMESRIADYFWATMHAIADEGKAGPRLFTFRQRDAGLSPKQLVSRPLEIQLWCEAEGHQHRVMESGKGVYPIDMPYEWLVQIAPYANFALNLLKTVLPVTAPAINTVMGANSMDNWKDELDLAKGIIDKLPAAKTPDHALSPREPLNEVERSGILALHRFLNEADPAQEKLGLHRVSTYTGDYRWLCKHHYDEYQPNIPDVIEGK